MDFTALKTAIQDAIKLNGNEEITGDILQGVLLSMVNTLGDSAINDLVSALANEVTNRQNADGTLQTNITNEAAARGNADTALGTRIDNEVTARENADTALSNRITAITDAIDNGYVYAGIATTSTEPATGKVFYLTTATGVFTNFGGITDNTKGIKILKKVGSTWTSDTVIVMDDTPTENSTNLVKSGGVYASIASVLSKIAEGYLYVGIATAATNPSTPTTKVFYIAVAAGTYTNFLDSGSAALVLTQGINILKYNGTAWSVEQVWGVDDNPTAGSNKLVKSGGVFNDIMTNGSAFDLSAYNNGTTYADLNAALTALNALPAAYKKGGMSLKFVQTSDNSYVQYRLKKNQFSTNVIDWENEEITKIAQEIGLNINSFVKGTLIPQKGYMLNDGSVFPVDGFHCYVIDFDCKEGDKFYYKGNGIYDAYSCIIFDSNNDIIDAQQYQSSSDYTPIVIPTGGIKIRLSSFTNTAYNITFNVYKENGTFDTINKLYIETNKLSMDVNSNILFTEQGGYLSYDGTYQAAPTYHSKSLKLDCKSGDIFYYKGLNGASAYALLVYNGNEIIERQQVGNINKFTKVVMPTNATKVVFSSYSDKNQDVIFEVRNGQNVRFLIDDIQKNTLSPEKKSSIGYMTSDGSILSIPAVSNYHCEYVDFDCSGGDIFYYRGQSGAAAYSHVIFDSSNNIIESGQLWSKEYYKIITIPTGGVKIRLSSYDSVEQPVVFEATTPKTLFGRTEYAFRNGTMEFNVKDVLYKKKWLAVGDSFTAGDFTHDTTGTYLFESGKYAGLNKVYPRFIALRNDMNLVMDAICGTTMAVATEYAENPADDPHLPYAYQRYLNIPVDVDYITIWFGINDRYVCTLGTISDSTIDTFYGAWNVVLEWIITNRPNAKVGIVITNGSTAEFREAEREIAKKWGIPYLDMMGDPQVPDIFGKETSGYSSVAQQLRYEHWRVSADNGHPNQFCHEYESTFIENWLRTL